MSSVRRKLFPPVSMCWFRFWLFEYVECLPTEGKKSPLDLPTVTIHSADRELAIHMPSFFPRSSETRDILKTREFESPKHDSSRPGLVFPFRQS